MLRISNLRVKHGRAEVLHGIDLEVREGEIVGLIGPNGAGKTTALLAISGIVRPAAGTIDYLGDSLVGESAAAIVRRGIVHVPQGRLVFPRMTVVENLLLGGYARAEVPASREFDAIYAMFPALAERRTQLAGSLSGGQQQMLAMARGMMAAPRLLLLDEPQLGLAPAVVEQVARIIREIHAAGCTVVLVGQHAPLALALSTRLYVLEAGRIAIGGQTSEVAADDRIQRAYLGVS